MRFLWICAAVAVTACGTDDTIFPGTQNAASTNVGPGSGGSAGSAQSTGGQSQGGNGGQGGVGTSCPAADAAAASQQVLLWSSLDSAASVTTPLAGDGSGAGLKTMPTDDFVAALSGSGLRLDAVGEYVRFPQTATNVSTTQGTVDFCYQPAGNHLDDANYTLFSLSLPTLFTMRAFIRLRKAAANNAHALQFIANDGISVAQWEVPSSGYQLNAGTWHRITASWSLAPGNALSVRLFIDGAELTVTPPQTLGLTMPVPDATQYIYFGAFGDTGDPPWIANGVLDEVVIYSAPIVP